MDRRTFTKTAVGAGVTVVLTGGASGPFAAGSPAAASAGVPRYWGVHYDTGVHFSPSRLSRETFEHRLVAREMRAIRRELNANAVRIIGEDLDRLEFAATAAIDNGLAVFLSPWLINHDETDILPFLAEAAELAERLRGRGGDVTFIAGCELSVFAKGFMPGETVIERLNWLINNPNPPIVEIVAKLDDLLGRAVTLIRQSFHGPVTYAAALFEFIDWTPFDTVGFDHYRSGGQTDDEYAAPFRDARGWNKPIQLLETGCCAYVGADLKGGMGFDVLDERPDGERYWVAGRPPERDEATQADYVDAAITTAVTEQLDAVFIYTFSAPYLPHDPVEENRDFDLAAFSLVKTYWPDTPRGRELPPWDPKRAYWAVATRYAAFRRGCR